MSLRLTSDVLLDYERGLAKLVIMAVIEATPHIGRPPSRNYIASILSGSHSYEINGTDGHRLDLFGVLGSMGRGSILELVDAAVRSGLLERFHSGGKGLLCTAKGRELYREPRGAAISPLGLVPAACDPTEIDLAMRAGVIEALRRLQASVALEREVPEWRVFSGSDFRKLAAHRPNNSTDLARIMGWHDPDTETARLMAAIGMIMDDHEPIIQRLREADLTNAEIAKERTAAKVATGLRDRHRGGRPESD